jgi:hypothetical protein
MLSAMLAVGLVHLILAMNTFAVIVTQKEVPAVLSLAGMISGTMKIIGKKLKRNAAIFQAINKMN